MISKNLSLWIAQSESWQTFIDFSLPEESIAKYPFINRPDDFYISLFGEMYDILEDVSSRKEDILSIAKGLEIFSLKGKRDSFNGVDQPSNILFAAGLYYLSDYASSAYILASIFESNNYEDDIDQFIWSFLKRKLVAGNPFCSLFAQYLETGDGQFIENLLSEIQKIKDEAYKHQPILFSKCFLAVEMIKKFRSNNIWFDLLKHNNKEHWDIYIKRATKKSFPVWDFFPSQRTALDKNILNTFDSIALQTPTSSGKTAICELLIYNEIKNNPAAKILYLAPFRALAAELKQSFGTNLSRLGITSKTIYGGNIPTGAEKELIQNVALLISTPEKFMALENSIKDFLKDFTMIICDEGHLLDDGNRGLNYELLLSRLKSQKDVKRKFVFISAIIPNIDKINSWLGGTTETVVQSKYRATEIEYGFLRPFDDDTYLLDVNPFKAVPQNYKLNKFLTTQDFTYKDGTQLYPWASVKVKSVAIALKALNSGSVALFTPTKGGNTGVAALADEVIKQLTTGLQLPNPRNHIKRESPTLQRLKEYFEVIFGKHYALCRLVNFGALFHHGDLPQYVREVIEDAIRAEEIKFVICTNTLAEGVNLPIRTIVINSAKRFNAETERQEPIPLRDLKNLVGRAGRAGRETKGLVIVVNPKDFNTIEQVIKDKNIEDVNGYLYDIIGNITKVITEKRLVLTNEILEAQDESFKELIDAVDISIIDLLTEEIQPEQLKETIENLINETFARSQANDRESTTLNSLIGLRGDKMLPYIKSNEFRYIKQSAATIREYNEIRSNLDLDNQLWANIDNPISDEWLSFIIDNQAANLSQVTYRLSQFNKINRTELTFADVKSVIKLWMSGNWFDKIAEACKCDIDTALRLINSFIGYHLQSACSSIIRNVEMRLTDDKRIISSTALNFPQYLLYGLFNPMHIALVEIGFNDRIGIMEVSKIVAGSGFTYDTIPELKRYLRNNREEILMDLEGKIPVISIEKTKEAFRYLGFLNMN